MNCELIKLFSQSYCRQFPLLEKLINMQVCKTSCELLSILKHLTHKS